MQLIRRSLWVIALLVGASSIGGLDVAGSRINSLDLSSGRPSVEPAFAATPDATRANPLLPVVALPSQSNPTFNPGAVTLSLSRLASGLQKPLFLTNAGDGSHRTFILEQRGRIRIVKGKVLLLTSFLDISGRVSCCDERGLLGLAFHPNYRTNGRFFVDYTDVNGNTVVSEFRRSSSNPNRASATSERILLRIAQPYPNHNGRDLAFGPDGYLYIGTGDGGSAGDPGNRAQNLSTLLGKLLRIDVDHRTGTRRYAIPATNPFRGRAGARPEIWSYGLRNPWRFSFDRLTGDLWIGDVGQARYEEVDRALHASGGGRGLNYGWRILEGRACYDPPSGCSKAGKTPPIAVYGHSFGCAVSGGYVYRGSSYPLLRGGYLFGDFCSGRIWSLTAGGPSSQRPRLMLDTTRAISSFGEDEAGNVYLVDYGAGDVFRIVGRARA